MRYSDMRMGYGSRIRIPALPHKVMVFFTLLGQKLLLVMGCVKLGEKNCVQLSSVGEQNAN